MTIKSWMNTLLFFLLFILINGVRIPSALAENDISDDVQINKSRMSYDRRTSENYFDASITNISYLSLLTPIKLVISSISSPMVDVVNPDGYTEEGFPFFEFTGDYEDILNDETTIIKSTRFSNPSRLRFSFSTQVVGNYKLPRIYLKSLPNNGNNVSLTQEFNWSAISHPEEEYVEYCIVINDRNDVENTQDDTTAYNTCDSEQIEYQYFTENYFPSITTLNLFPEDVLEVGKDYTWSVFARDKFGNTSSSYWYNFDTNVQTPIIETVPIAGGGYSTIGLKSDGTVVAAGLNSCGRNNVETWTDIVVVSAGLNHNVGLKSDGTVVAAGCNSYGTLNIENWTDIVAIVAGMNITLGLKSDGTVVALGNNTHGQLDIENWTDIVAISSTVYSTVGLKSDGTVLAVGNNNDDQLNIENWTDIVAISSGKRCTVGLKSDGTVVGVGQNWYGQLDFENWTDIIAISHAGDSTVGLKSDGTVVGAGALNSFEYSFTNWTDVIENWTDIIAIVKRSSSIVGLKSDGTIVSYGANRYGQIDLESWSDIGIYESDAFLLKVDDSNLAYDHGPSIWNSRENTRTAAIAVGGPSGIVSKENDVFLDSPHGIATANGKTFISNWIDTTWANNRGSNTSINTVYDRSYDSGQSPGPSPNDNSIFEVVSFTDEGSVKNGTSNEYAYAFTYFTLRDNANQAISFTEYIDHLEAVSNEYGPIGRLTIIAHGNYGTIYISQGPTPEQSATLTLQTITDENHEHYRGLSKLRSEGILAEDAHILLFSCLTGGRSVGKKFVKQIANLTGAYVHANTDLTGPISVSKFLGVIPYGSQDWELDRVCDANDCWSDSN